MGDGQGGQERRDSATELFLMFIGAGLFAYFGFATQWMHQSAVTGQTLAFVVLLDWTLKISAGVMAVSIVLYFLHRPFARIVYALIALLSAVSFVVVAVLDWMDPQHTALHPIILILFAAFNGYGAFMSLIEPMLLRRDLPAHSGG